MRNRCRIFVYIVFISVYLSSCSYESEEENYGKNEEEIYNEKATEFMEQVLSRSDDCSCLVVNSSSKGIEEMSLTGILRKNDPYKMVIEKLNFTSTTAFESALNISINFQFKSSIINPKTKILNRSTYDSLLVKGNEDAMKGLLKNRLDVINAMCPKTILTISKPIFDKTYTTAIANVQNDRTCLVLPYCIYKWKDGIWKLTLL